MNGWDALPSIFMVFLNIISPVLIGLDVNTSGFIDNIFQIH